MKPRTVMVQLEIRDCEDNIDQLKKAFRKCVGGFTGIVAQVSVSVAQPSKKKSKKRK